ncbi:sensor histidine kinase [Peterkaempfera griseoplana]|uniref:sensor histidine kinase n=1 Tax=Peterkaempfera griseoplana TaxID=66896 RepID=UPI0006E1221E|nr:sensor histidine kinase [Peterkaempfera griseoplana]
MDTATANGHERRVALLLDTVPYFGLVVSVVLTALFDSPGPPATVQTALIAGAAGGWILWLVTLHPGWRERPGVMALYYTGLIVVVGVLVARSPLFGFFGFTGYLHADLLPGRWKVAGVAATVPLMASTQVGGFRAITSGAMVTLYAVFILVNLVIGGSVMYAGLLSERRSTQRGHMVEELAEANRRLEATLEENAGLHAQLVVQAREAGVLDERRRMAGEIHDTLAQGLIGILTQLEAADRSTGRPEQHRRHLELARRLARDSLAEARRSVQALRPGPLAAAPHLPQAVRDLAHGWAETSGVAVRVEVTGEPVPLPAGLEVALFRAAQEALANVAKHARASRAGVTLSYTPDVVVLDVRDDGTGFAAADAGQPRPSGADGGYGMTAMRRRLRQAGGTLEVESMPGEGTAVSARVPVLEVVA